MVESHKEKRQREHEAEEYKAKKQEKYNRRNPMNEEKILYENWREPKENYSGINPMEPKNSRTIDAYYKDSDENNLSQSNPMPKKLKTDKAPILTSIYPSEPEIVNSPKEVTRPASPTSVTHTSVSEKIEKLQGVKDAAVTLSSSGVTVGKLDYSSNPFLANDRLKKNQGKGL